MATEQLTDQEKLFRVRARRRLIGAVALVLLMLTILPMLLDDRSNQKMPASDVAISIPSQDDGNFSSKIVPATPAPAEVAAQPESMQNPVESPAEVKPPAVETKPVVEAKPEAPVSKPKPEPTAKPPEKTVEKVAVEKSAEARKVGVSVQVGVISEGEKVKQVISKIEGLGLKANTENLNTPTGVKVRIRSGPYPNKEEAEKALETLKSAGFKPILVMHK
ncbi:MAG: SPOR domain-containing protein [Methylophilaceae bacterium]